MSHLLHIRHLQNRYRLPAAAEADAARTRLDRVAGVRVPELVEALLPGLLSELGVGPDAEVLVRYLALRVRIRGETWDDHQLALAWARGLVERLRAGLRRGGVRSAAASPLGGRARVSDEYAVFTDRLNAEACWLIEHLAGSAPWWGPLLFDGSPPRPASVLLGWVERQPAAVVAFVHYGASTMPRRFAAALDDHEAAALHVTLRTRENRAAEALSLASPGRSPPGASPISQAPAEDAELTTVAGVVDAPARSPNFPTAPARAEVAAVATALGPAGLAAVRAMPGRERRLLVSLAWLLRERPFLVRLGDRRLGEIIEALAVEGHPTPELLPSPLRGVAMSRHAGPCATTDRGITAKQETVDPTRADDETGLLLAAAPALQVGCGGLLFLLRPVLRGPWLEESPVDDLRGRLHALGALVLTRVLGPLPEGERRAALARERPLLSAFSGLDLGDDTSPPVIDDAIEAELARLTDLLPDELTPAPLGFEFTYGGDDPFRADPRLRRLAAMVLRPGLLARADEQFDLTFPDDHLDVVVRRGGWDLDPGWIPWIGRTIRFHYAPRR